MGSAKKNTTKRQMILRKVAKDNSELLDAMKTVDRLHQGIFPKNTSFFPRNLAKMLGEEFFEKGKILLHHFRQAFDSSSSILDLLKEEYRKAVESAKLELERELAEESKSV